MTSEVARIKRNVSGSALQTTAHRTITNITVEERGAELRRGEGSTGWRVRGKRPSPAWDKFRLELLCLSTPVGPSHFRGHPTMRRLRADVRRVPLSGSRGDPAHCCQRPGGEAEVSAGPEAPCGSGFPGVPSPPLRPGRSQSAGTPRLWDPGKPGSAGRVCVVAWLVRSSPGRREPGFCRERRGGGRGGEGGGTYPSRGALLGARGSGRRARAGPAVTGQRRKERVTPIPAPELPSPRPGPAGRDGYGFRGPRAAEPLAGVLAARATRLGPPLRPGSDFLLRRAMPRTFCGGRGEGSGIASAAGKWRLGRGRLADCLRLCR